MEHLSLPKPISLLFISPQNLYNKRGTDTKQGEVDSHYKREGDGQYTGGMHIQNVSIPLFNYLFSEKIESVPLFIRMYAMESIH